MVGGTILGDSFLGSSGDFGAPGKPAAYGGQMDREDYFHKAVDDDRAGFYGLSDQFYAGNGKCRR